MLLIFTLSLKLVFSMYNIFLNLISIPVSVEPILEYSRMCTVEHFHEESSCQESRFLVDYLPFMVGLNDELIQMTTHLDWVTDFLQKYVSELHKVDDLDISTEQKSPNRMTVFKISKQNFSRNSYRKDNLLDRINYFKTDKTNFRISISYFVWFFTFINWF